MKVEDLIKKLEEIPPHFHVAIEEWHSYGYLVKEIDGINVDNENETMTFATIESVGGFA